MSGEKNNLYHDEGALRILEALSAVDEELLERSGMPVAAEVAQQDNGKVTDMSPCREQFKKHRQGLWRYGRVCAACLALLVVGAISWNGLQLTLMIWSAWGGANAQDSTTSGGSNRTGDTAAVVNGSDGVPALEGMEEMGIGFSGTESYNENAYQEAVGNPEAEEERSDSFRQPEDSPSIEDDNIADGCTLPPDSRKITEEEARSAEILGAYLPAELPAGYVFESARMDAQGQLALCWRRGMDSIFLSVTFAEAEGIVTADVNRPETYDEWLYDIPYAETVPKEYREIFNNPVFAAEDLSLEVVSSRMKTYEDAGDTNTPRGSFSVLYPEGVLVHFDGRGTAQEIWNMLREPCRSGP